MDQKINTIVDDLYRIEPAFKAHDEKVRALVKVMLEAEPDTKFDEAFARRLRLELMAAPAAAKLSPYAFLSLRSIRYGAFPVLVTVLLVAPLTYFAAKRSSSTTPFTAFQYSQNIDEKGTRAFGTIRGSASPGRGGDAVDASRNKATESAPPEMAASSVVTQDVSIGSAAGLSSPSRMIVDYIPEILQYEYKGEPITLTETEGKVYKRVKGAASAGQMVSILKNLDFGLADMSAFKNLKVRTIELGEDSSLGYLIYVNFEEGSININPNWEKWPADINRAYAGTPDRKELIAIADAFLKRHGINRSIYGEPVVEALPDALSDATGTELGRSNEVVNIVYPLSLGGYPVYDEAGQPYGLAVSVNALEKKVSAVYNLTSQTYESSSYSLETNPDAMIKAAAFNDPPFWIMEEDVRTRTKTISLQTPQRVLMRYFKYEESSRTSQELYVPALLFPVEQKGIEYYPKNKIIPLVKEILSERSTLPIDGVIVPLKTN